MRELEKKIKYLTDKLKQLAEWDDNKQREISDLKRDLSSYGHVHCKKCGHVISKNFRSMEYDIKICTDCMRIETWKKYKRKKK